MKRILWTFLAICSTSFLLACSKGSDNNTVTGNCPVGSTLNSYGQCVNSYGQVIGLDPNGYNNGSSIISYFADNWSSQRSITITDATAYKEFLRTTMGVCDRLQNTGGTASCQSWVNGGLDVIMMSPDTSGQNMNITFRAWPNISQYGYYSYQSPGVAGAIGAFFGIPYQVNAGGYFNPMSKNDWTVSVVNNSQGFEARSYGPLYSVGNRSLIQVRVDQGKLGDGSFTVKFGFPNCVQDSTHSCSGQAGVWFAQGTFKRCQTSYCSTGLW